VAKFYLSLFPGGGIQNWDTAGPQWDITANECHAMAETANPQKSVLLPLPYPCVWVNLMTMGDEVAE
jgi:hypothetical protein